MNNTSFNLKEFLTPYKGLLEKSGLPRLKYYEYVIEKLVNLNDFIGDSWKDYYYVKNGKLQNGSVA